MAYSCARQFAVGWCLRGGNFGGNTGRLALPESMLACARGSALYDNVDSRLLTAPLDLSGISPASQTFRAAVVIYPCCFCGNVLDKGQHF